MKIALDRNGIPIEAAAGAPAQALCPHCGGVVILRQRTRSHLPGDVSYFWRHLDHDNTGCTARFTVGIRKAPGKGPMDDSARQAPEAP
ncbi:MAG: hypothetical protein ACFLMY_16235 [Candidatus Brachytrichaceae bacterium NZ_4S206]